MKQAGKALFGALRVVLAIGIIVLMLRQVGIASVLEHLRRADLLLVAGAFLAITAEALFKVLNWQQMLSVMLHQKLDYGRLLHSNLCGCFLGTAVPSSAGTDALRAIYSHRHYGGPFIVHAAAMVVLNGFNWFIGSVLGVIVAAMLLAFGSLPLAMDVVVLLLLGIAVGGPTLYLLLKWRRRWLVLSLRRVRRRWFRLRNMVRRLIDALLIFEEAHANLGRISLVAAAGVLMQALCWLLAARSVDVSIPFAVCVLMVPVSGLANFVPLSIAGFGFVQVAHIGVLSLFGVETAAALVVSALVMLCATGYNLLWGGAAFLFSGRPKAG